jgi:parvulin-like peptidyl-prolyl isomerase
MRSVKLALMMLAILALAGLWMGGCDKNTEQAADAPAADAVDPAAADKAAADTTADKPKTETFAASHVLIAYKGAMRAAETVTRTKEEAQALAKTVATELAKDPSKLEEEAKKVSDCPSGPGGGDLGSWIKGMFVPEFEKATEALKVGEVTPEPIETPFGFHVIRRNKAMEQVEVSARQIVVQWKDALGNADSTITRSKEEALARATEAAQKAKADPNAFDEVSKAYNDAPTDHLPIWETGQRMPKEFDQAVLGLKIGDISDPVESPFGYHVFKRIEVVHQPEISGSHILIQFTTAKGARENITINKEEAKAKAEKLLAELKAKPELFDEYALKFSDDPMVTRSKGNLGVWEKGNMLPEFDEAIDKLKIDEIGGPVETPFGFHIIRRNEPKPDVQIDFGDQAPPDQAQ